MYSQVSHLYSIWPVYFTCEEYHADDSLGPVHGMVPYLWFALEELYSTFFWRVCWHSTVHKFLELAAHYGSLISTRSGLRVHCTSTLLGSTILRQGTGPWLNNFPQAESPLHKYSPWINSLTAGYRPLIEQLSAGWESLATQCNSTLRGSTV